MRVSIKGVLHIDPQTKDLYLNDMDLHKILEALLPENYRCSCREHSDPIIITIEAGEQG